MGVSPEERLAGAPGGGSEETKQVEQFLDDEHEKFKKVDTATPPPEVQVH